MTTYCVTCGKELIAYAADLGANQCDGCFRDEMEGAFEECERCECDRVSRICPKCKDKLCAECVEAGCLASGCPYLADAYREVFHK